MPQYMTTKELADHLRVTKLTIYRWREKGLPFTRIGRTIRFNLDDVNKWLELQNQETR